MLLCSMLLILFATKEVMSDLYDELGNLDFPDEENTVHAALSTSADTLHAVLSGNVSDEHLDASHLDASLPDGSVDPYDAVWSQPLLPSVTYRKRRADPTPSPVPSKTTVDGNGSRGEGSPEHSERAGSEAAAAVRGAVPVATSTPVTTARGPVNGTTGATFPFPQTAIPALLEYDIPAEKRQELQAQVFVQRMLAREQQMMAEAKEQKRKKERAHEREVERLRKEQKEEAQLRFNLAEKKLKAFEPGAMVDAWCLSFKETCELFQLDKKQALRLFFVKVTTDSTWIMEYRADDRKRGKVVEDADQWIARLRRTYAQSYSTKLQIVKNLRQDENEAADSFVHRFRSKAKAAHADWSTTELINMMAGAVHPKWRQSFMLMNQACKTWPDVIEALSKAMSPQMAGLRKLFVDYKVGDEEDQSESPSAGTSVVTAAAATMESDVSQTRSRQSKERDGKANAAFETSNGRNNGNWNNDRRSQYRNSDNRRNANSDACRKCGQAGHWQRECPLNDPGIQQTFAQYLEKAKGKATSASVPKNG